MESCNEVSFVHIFLCFFIVLDWKYCLKNYQLLSIYPILIFFATIIYMKQIPRFYLIIKFILSNQMIHSQGKRMA